MRRKKGIPLDDADPGNGPLCDAPGCNEPGVYRAPRSRERLNDFYWFCLDHVRDYNRRWNYCSGMSERQIEAEIRNDTVWRRPTWPLGGNQAKMRHGFETGRFNDPYGIGDDGDIGDDSDDRSGEAARRGAGGPEQVALRTLGLMPPVNLTQLKARYKELVKQLHPDANGGDKAAEERLKGINEAYTTLRRFLAA